MEQVPGIYILLISIHGLIRGQNLELGCNADTGGQTKYVVELARALGQCPEVARVDLMTRLIADPAYAEEYAQEIEPLDTAGKVRIVRIECGGTEYIAKEQLWDYLDYFADNALVYLKQQPYLPHVLHSHYADAGYVGALLSHQLSIPLIYTGHSLGRSKRKHLLASGVKAEAIETRYKMSRRIEAEEYALSVAERVITSTRQEINEQYGLYDYSQVEKMFVIPPGVDLEKFSPATGDELHSPIAQDIQRFLRDPNKPLILALLRPDPRKNISTLIEAFGESKDLQVAANLLIVAGNRDNIHELDSTAEEVLTDLLITVDLYDLYGKIAYPKHHSAEEVGLIYRLAACLGGVFINPALTEPFGLTLLEAAASGLPIVATEDGGPIDIIHNCNNGYLVNPLDKADIAEKLLSLLNTKERTTLVENGIKGVKLHYSWQAHAQTYLQLVSSLISRSEPLIRLSLPRTAPSLEEVKQRLQQNEQAVNVVFSFGQYLDIIPTRASKGLALRWYAEQWDVPLEHILVAGGSGADEDMLRGNTLGVVVANRHHEELSDLIDLKDVYFASRPYAAGILEAIQHYDFFNTCTAPRQ